MRTTDNNRGECISTLRMSDEDLIFLGNKSIRKLAKEENLLIFPHCLHAEHKDVNEEDVLFSLHPIKGKEYRITTGNLMGFVGRNNTQLTISSRFYPKGDDFFLHYMLQKVFAINVFDLKHSTNKENIWDFLLYLFPYYLKQALNQGLFKEYMYNEYNDGNVKGTIDVSRHIRINNPFQGKVAYRTREHSYDNRITQLVRHTIEYIRVHKFGSGILQNDTDTQNAVSQIVYATSTYEKGKRQTIINQNIKPFNHPYFTKYAMLQKICLQILRQEGLTYGQEKDKAYGLLFDGAWLWEEYLNTILNGKGFEHPQNKNETGAIHLFKEKSVTRYPDFYKQKEIVLDAKYKRLQYKDVPGLDRDDLHQIITYMYILKVDKGGFVFPIETKDNTQKITTPPKDLHGYGGTVTLYGLPINQQAKEYSEFCQEMNKSENKFKEML